MHETDDQLYIYENIPLYSMRLHRFFNQNKQNIDNRARQNIMQNLTVPYARVQQDRIYAK